jgi:hypothetical protein
MKETRNVNHPGRTWPLASFRKIEGRAPAPPRKERRKNRGVSTARSLLALLRF